MRDVGWRVRAVFPTAAEHHERPERHHRRRDRHRRPEAVDERLAACGHELRGCGFDQPELRGALIGALNVGLAMARHVLGIEPLASLDAASLVDIVGDSTQRILTARLPSPSDGPPTPAAAGGGERVGPDVDNV